MFELVRPGTIIRWNRLKDTLSDITDQSAVVIDVGGYDGLIGKFLSEHRKARYYGIDVDMQGLIKTKEKGLSGICGSGTHLPIDDNCADVALLLDVIEHVYDHEQLLREVYRIIKPQGKIILTTPIAEQKLVPWVDMHRVHRLWDHIFREGYSYQEINDLIYQSGFIVKDYTTAFNILSRWSYYTHFLLPGARRFLAKHRGLFILSTFAEPFIKYRGLTHVFILTKS